MKQILAYMKLSYKQLLWMVFLMLFLLQFKVYYEEGKFINESLWSSAEYADLYFSVVLASFMWITVVGGFKVKNDVQKKKMSKMDMVIIATSIIYLALLFLLKEYKFLLIGISNILRILLATFIPLTYLENKNNKIILKTLPISSKNRNISIIAVSILVILVSNVFTSSVVYVDKFLNSGDLAKLYNGSIKALFVVASLLCYRKFNVKKKREEDVTESFVYKTLKGFGGK